MINIRQGVFETNSSSVHSMALLNPEEYEKWGEDGYYLDMGHNTVITREEAKTFVSEYVDKWGYSYPEDEEEFDEILMYKGIYSPASFEDYTEYFETFVETYDKDGRLLYGVGYAGRDG